jgi:P-type E1-E2 ATPase
MSQERLIRFPLQLPALTVVVEAAKQALQGANGVLRIEVELGDIEILVYVSVDAFIVESLLAARLEAAGIGLQGQEPEERPLAFSTVEDIEAPKAPPKPAFARSLPIMGQSSSAPPKPANRLAMRWVSIPTGELKEKEARLVEAQLLHVPGVSRAVIETKLSRALVRVRAGEFKREALLAITGGAAPSLRTPTLITVPTLDDPGLADALERQVKDTVANPASGLALCQAPSQEKALLDAARRLGLTAAPRGEKLSYSSAPALLGAFIAVTLLLSSLVSLGDSKLFSPIVKTLLAGLSVALSGGLAPLYYQRADWLRWLAAFGCVFGSYTLPDSLFAETAAMMSLGFFIGREFEVHQRRQHAAPLLQLIQRIHMTARVEEQRDGNTLTRDKVTPKPGDTVIVRAGERVPVDGPVIRGRADLTTFDALPAGPLRPGEYAFAGQEISSGEVAVRAVAIESDTFLGSLITGSEEARASRPPAPTYLRFATPSLLVMAALLGLLFYLLGGPTQAIAMSLGLLLLTSSASWRVGADAAYAKAIALAAYYGIRVKDTASLWSAATLNTVLFDRSGALQRGEWRVSDAAPLYNQPEENLVRYAASASNGTAHPIAEAIVDYARSTEVSIPEAEMQDPIPGEGVLASVLGRAVYVGTAELMEENNISIKLVADSVAPLEQDGKEIVYVAVDRRLIGFLAVEDSPKRGIKDAVTSIKKLGLKTIVVSGGSTPTVKTLADFAGIEQVFANVPAHRRPWEIASLREEGKKVLAVGDTERDAPLLIAANLSMGLASYGEKSLWSFETAKREPEAAAKLLSLSSAAYHSSRRAVLVTSLAHSATFLLLVVGVLPLPFAALFGSLANAIAVGTATRGPSVTA